MVVTRYSVPCMLWFVHCSLGLTSYESLGSIRTFLQAFARSRFAGAPPSALQYQGFCGNVTSCQIVASGLSATYNYTMVLFASTAANVAFDLSLTCVNNVDPLAVVVYATLPPQRYSAIPVSNTPCYGFFGSVCD